MTRRTVQFATSESHMKTPLSNNCAAAPKFTFWEQSPKHSHWRVHCTASTWKASLWRRKEVDWLRVKRCQGRVLLLKSLNYLPGPALASFLPNLFVFDWKVEIARNVRMLKASVQLHNVQKDLSKFGAKETRKSINNWKEKKGKTMVQIWANKP